MLILSWMSNCKILIPRFAEAFYLVLVFQSIAPGLWDASNTQALLP